jgi:hypothetical protein
MIPVYSPRSESEAAVIVSLMQAYSIPFFMRGGAFSSMYPGPVSNSLNARTLMVDDAHAELARELVRPFSGT